LSKKKTDTTAATVRAATGDDDARVWLRANGYDDIAQQIDQVMNRPGNPRGLVM
jgi:hypothetical protein